MRGSTAHHVLAGSSLYGAHLQSIERGLSLPWQIPLLAVQITLLLGLLVCWSVRLCRRGRDLATEPDIQAPASRLTSGGEVQPDLTIRTAEFQNIKDNAQKLLKAKMNFNFESTEAQEVKIAEILENELKTVRGEDVKKARRLLLAKVRCLLVKNPYDIIGRRMAKEIKNIFVRRVLGEKRWWHKFELNQIVNKFGCNNKDILIRLPIFFALLNVLQSSGVYFYDIASDVNVMKTIDHQYSSFQMPDFTKLENISQSKIAEDFLLKEFQSEGIKGIERPCQFLDTIEDTFRETSKSVDYFFRYASFSCTAQSYKQPPHHRRKHVQDLTDEALSSKYDILLALAALAVHFQELC